jgi:hypothetical protein
VGVCRGCGAYTQPRNGKGDAYAYCKRCHPGAIQRRWARELVVAAMLDWQSRYRRLPSSYDWSLPHARRRGGEALARLEHGVVRREPPPTRRGRAGPAPPPPPDVLGPVLRVLILAARSPVFVSPSSSACGGVMSTGPQSGCG